MQKHLPGGVEYVRFKAMIQQLLDLVMQSPAGAELVGKIRQSGAGTRLPLTGVAGSLDAVLIAGTFGILGRQTLVICPDHERAERVADDLVLCLGTDPVMLFGKKDRADHQSGAAEDVRALRALAEHETIVVVSELRGILERLPDPSSLSGRTFNLKREESYAFADLVRRLVELGFTQKEFVDAAGDFALRGGILDIFPYASDSPVRIEFFGEAIESIREFDPISQRSIKSLNAAMIVPDLKNTVAEEGKPGQATLLDFFSPDAMIILEDPDALLAILDKHSGSEASAEYVRDILEGKRVDRATISIESIRSPEYAISFGSKSPPAINGSVQILRKVLAEFQRDEYSITIMGDGQGELNRLKDLLGTEVGVFDRGGETPSPGGEPPVDMESIQLVAQSLHEGFVLHGLRYAVFTEHQIFNRLKRRGRRKAGKFRGLTEKEFQLLKRGDFVVHQDFGIGRFDGLKKIQIRGAEQEVVSLSYDAGDRLYVNLNYLNKLQKYSSKEGHIPALTRLGSPEWDRLKARAKKKLKDIARNLIRLYAQRKTLPGFAFQRDTPWQKELEATFMYEDTFDQAKTTREVKDDMEAPWPMDRLVCGDVGFGKTEVAVRAAFKAVLDGKQVALLVPTTILALQHYNTFVDRMSKYAIRIEVLSRFKSKRQQVEILNLLTAGSIDIMIGTHRLLSKDVQFKNLGLLIIDEEHRFGVSAKEKLRQARVTVDTLALTATPIPRTLHFSLLGARDLSLIGTPPRNRRPVITEIAEWNNELIAEAVGREIARGGQIFFVHDRIQNMEEVANRLRTILSSARIRLAHGQMHAHELENVMMEFLEKRFDMLVSTKIIESGLDMPNVNTMIINRADRFGMAELYQLRGRVGRSNVQAYAYLLTPPIGSLPGATIRRLQAVEEFTELGSGFNLAMRDLEIRGTGNLLGSEQSGFIETMGFETYTRILEETVRELKEEDFKELFEKDLAGQPPSVETIIEPEFDAYIPEEYIRSDTERLSIYRRLYKVTTEEQLAELGEELRDRFGTPPLEVKSLIGVVRVRLFASKHQLKKVRIGKDAVEVELPPESNSWFYDGGSFQKLMHRISMAKVPRARLTEDEKRLTLTINIPLDDDPPQAAMNTLSALRELLSDKES